MFPKLFGEQEQFPMFLKIFNFWGTREHSSPSSSKVFEERQQSPKFLKSVWGTGTVPQVHQNVNYLGNTGTVFPMFLKSVLVTILGNFGEQARQKLVIKC